MNVLVLGGYGLIGSALVDRLTADGHDVTGLGRDVTAASRQRPKAQWIAADMSRLLSATDWTPLLQGIDVVVNAAGALQDGARDRLDLVHNKSIAALVEACGIAGVRRLVQISAVGVTADCTSAFFNSKAAGDAAVMASPLEWVILRPGLVIAPGAYGGTALLRALAAVPGLAPGLGTIQPIQTVSVFDVADAISRSVAGTIPSGTVADLVEDDRHSLAEVIAAFRAWLGLPPPRFVPLPAFVGVIAARLADVLGGLGWRSPLRSTALAALSQGVLGDPTRWHALTGQRLRSLEQSLVTTPAQVQEQWFARLWLLKPIILICLALFWIVSGLIGIARFSAAVEVLTTRGMGDELAVAFVGTGSAVDVVLGSLVAVRRYAKAALIGMVLATVGYLIGGTIFASDLWFDPLGSLVKTVPVLCLIFVALAVLDER